MKMLFKRITAIVVMVCLFTLVISATSSIQVLQFDPVDVLCEYNKLMNSFIPDVETASTATSSRERYDYPSDYGGAYYGDDGLLHINVTSSLDNIGAYTGIVNDDMVVFHVVDYSFDYLLSIHDILMPYMTQYGIYDISTIQADNKTYVYTDSASYVNQIYSVLNMNNINSDSYEIVVEDNSIEVCTEQSEIDTQDTPTRIVGTKYFRPGNVVYNWSNGYAVTWATVLCNAKRVVGNQTVYGFVTAGHLWWDCSSAGDSTKKLAEKTDSNTVIDYYADATFIPFNDSSYGTTGRISNSSLYGSSSYYMGYYITSTDGLENYSLTAFGKTTGKTNNITVISTSSTFSIVDDNTGTSYTITGIKTDGYSSGGDSGGPVVYYNQYGNYTLVGMTSARGKSGLRYNYIVPMYNIVSSLGITMEADNN